MIDRRIYKCKACGWEKAIPDQWMDMAPRYCGNHKCEYSGRIKRNPNSFVKSKDMLEIILPKKPEIAKEKEHKAKTPTSEERKVSSESAEKSKQRRARKRRSRGTS